MLYKICFRGALQKQNLQKQRISDKVERNNAQIYADWKIQCLSTLYR